MRAVPVAADEALTHDVEFDNMPGMLPRTISWLKAAAKEFADFPVEAQVDMLVALRIAARGEKADIAKPFKSVGSGVFEIALRHRGDAFRVIYVVQIRETVWVVDAFQKKSTSGIKTPQIDVDRIKKRIGRLREAYK